MSLKRTTIIFVSAVALAAWFAAAMNPTRPPVSRASSTRAPLDVTGDTLATEIARLRERLRPDPAPRAPTRNPFRFRSASPRSAAAPTAVDVSPYPPPVDEFVARPSLSLLGVAEDAGPDGPERTAVISGGGQLFLAKEHDTVTDRDVGYTVDRIFPESVELTDSRDGTTLRLTLK